MTDRPFLDALLFATLASCKLYGRPGIDFGDVEIVLIWPWLGDHRLAAYHVYCVADGRLLTDGVRSVL